MTGNSNPRGASIGIQWKPTVIGGIIGLLCSFGIKALTTKGSFIGPGTTAGDILGIPLLLAIGVPIILVVTGIILRRRRPGILPFGLAMGVALFLPLAMP